jgi:antitoxin PrlF
MAVAVLSSKGQVTIPKLIRDSLGLSMGDKLEFLVSDKGEAVLRPVTKHVDDVFGRLHKPGRRAVTVEEMDAAIARRLRRTEDLV